MNDEAGAARADGLDKVLLRMPLSEAGYAPRVHDAYRRLLRDAHRALDDGDVPADGRRAWIAPGRIEVLGKHVDYAGGRSLLCTVQRGIVVVARTNAQRTLVLRDARRREALTLSIDTPARMPLPWSVYPRTVIHRLRRNFGDIVQGADVAIASNLPPAAGVSSSSAFVVALTLALGGLSNIASSAAWRESITDRLSLAGYLGALENGLGFRALSGEVGVGTMGGAQDQTAILCCAPMQLDMFAWSPVRHERGVAWPRDHSFVIGVSGVVAAKTGAARERYNRAARMVHRLVAAWNAATEGNARTLADAFVQGAGGSDPRGVPEVLRKASRRAADHEFSEAQLDARLQQFFDETYRFVPDAVKALGANAFDEFGRIVARSQRGAEEALENQIVETVSLVREANALGAVASSAFGAGFGGSVWAMVPTASADAFAARWREIFANAHRSASRRSQFFTTEPSAAAFEVADADRFRMLTRPSD